MFIHESELALVFFLLSATPFFTMLGTSCFILRIFSRPSDRESAKSGNMTKLKGLFTHQNGRYTKPMDNIIYAKTKSLTTILLSADEKRRQFKFYPSFRNFQVKNDHFLTKQERS